MVDSDFLKGLITVVIVGLITGLVGGMIGSPILGIPGPQGLQGPQGIQGVQGIQGPQGIHGVQGIQGIQGEQGQQGEQGPQGIQGVQGIQGIQGPPGVDGADSIIQIIQSINATDFDPSSFAQDQWHNMSDLDSSMRIEMDVQDQSRIFAKFSCSLELGAETQIWLRISVDNMLNSTVVMCRIGSPSTAIWYVPCYVEFLTSSLAAGQHIIEIQFQRDASSPIVLGRTFTVMEMASP